MQERTCAKPEVGPFTVTVVGLGLMGASLAMALKGFKDAHIIGLNRSEDSVRRALTEGAVDEGYSWIKEEGAARTALGCSNLVVICLYADAAMDFLRGFGGSCKAGAVVTDVTGVKEAMIALAEESLPSNVDFVGAHPMAGRECSGYESAIPDLFAGCNYVITPHEKNRPESIALVQDMARYVGAGRITMADAATHDEMIAYTSQMAHVLASAIVQNSRLTPSLGFEGNSFGDLTRVARGISGGMWSELFVLNRAPLSAVLRELEESIADLRQRTEAGDKEGIRKILEDTARRKAEWEERHEENVNGGV